MKFRFWHIAECHVIKYDAQKRSVNAIFKTRAINTHELMNQISQHFN